MTGRAGVPPPDLRGVRVSLWHPFTARAVGWTEDRLAAVHSAPHVRALADLARTDGLVPRVEYLTDRRRPRRERGEVDRWFWPRALRGRRRADQFRHEVGLAAIVALAARPPDVLVVNTSGHGGSFARALARAQRARRRPYVAMVGGLHATLEGPNLGYLCGAARVAVHNTAVGDAAVAAGVDRDRLAVVPLGVDTDAFHPGAGGPRADGPARLLYVGRLAEWKGVHLLVAAVDALRDAGVVAHLDVVGPVEDEAYGRTLRDQVATLGLGAVVTFRPAVARAELPALYREADVLVLPSSGEGFGMVVVEAMACGTPVVALDEPGGPRDTITSGVDGWLVGRDELAGRLAAVLADEPARAAAGQAARRTAEEHLSAPATAAAFRALLVGALGGGA